MNTKKDCCGAISPDNVHFKDCHTDSTKNREENCWERYSGNPQDALDSIGEFLSPAKEPSFIESSLAEFYTKFPESWDERGAAVIFGSHEELYKWLSSKLQEATQDIDASSYDAGYAAGKAYWEPSEHHKNIWRKEERTRILGVLEKEKKVVPVFKWTKENLLGFKSARIAWDLIIAEARAHNAAIDSIIKKL